MLFELLCVGLRETNKEFSELQEKVVKEKLEFVKEVFNWYWYNECSRYPYVNSTSVFLSNHLIEAYHPFAMSPMLVRQWIFREVTRGCELPENRSAHVLDTMIEIDRFVNISDFSKGMVEFSLEKKKYRTNTDGSNTLLKKYKLYKTTLKIRKHEYVLHKILPKDIIK